MRLLERVGAGLAVAVLAFFSLVGCLDLSSLPRLSLSWPGPATVGAPSTATAQFLLPSANGATAPVAGASISFDLGGSFFGWGKTDATGTVRVTAPVLASVGTGTKPIRATCISCTGATISSEGTLQVVGPDMTPPAVPTISISTTPTSWTAFFASSDNAGGSGLATFVYSVGYQGETPLPAANAAGPTNSLTIGQSVPGYAVPRPGTWFFLVRAVDKAGNSSAYGSQQFTIPPRTPSLTLGDLPDPLRIGDRYAPTARLFDPATPGYAGRPLGGRPLQLAVGNTGSATSTDGAGNATFYGFTPSGSPGVQSGVLEFRGDASGEVGPARVTFTRTVIPAAPPPSPPTGLAARFITAALTELRWNAPPGGGPVTYYIRLNGGYEWSMSNTSWQGLYQPGTYTLQVRARDALGRFSPYATLTFTQPGAPTTLSNWVWQPVPARLGSFVATRADLTWNQPASIYAQPGSGTLAGWPLTFSLGSQTFGGYASVFNTQTVQAGPGTLPTSVAFAGGGYYAPARLNGTLVVLANDTTPPSVPVVSIAPSVNTVNTFSVQASTSDNAGGLGVQRIAYRIDGGAEVPGATYSSPAPSVVWSFPSLTAPSPGVHTFQARAVDAAGNVSAYSAPVTFEWRPGQAHWSTSTSVQAACSGGRPSGSVTVRGVLLDQDSKPLAGRYVTITGGRLPSSSYTAADGSASFAGQTGGLFILSYSGDASFVAGATAIVNAPGQPPCATPTPTPSPTPTPPPPDPTPPPSPSPSTSPSTPSPYTVDIPPS